MALGYFTKEGKQVMFMKFLFPNSCISGSFQLPQDILVHIFSFLDMQSLVSSGQVSW